MEFPETDFQPPEKKAKLGGFFGKLFGRKKKGGKGKLASILSDQAGAFGRRPEDFGEQGNGFIPGKDSYKKKPSDAEYGKGDKPDKPAEIPGDQMAEEAVDREEAVEREEPAGMFEGLTADEELTASEEPAGVFGAPATDENSEDEPGGGEHMFPVMPVMDIGLSAEPEPEPMEEQKSEGQINSGYLEECYLKFGFDAIDRAISLEGAKEYLTARGFNDSALTKARHRDGMEPTALDMQAINHCDFCGIPISGVSYQRLTDGRVRCNDCGATAITSVEEFKKIFYQSLELMQSFFGIEHKVPVFVKTVDARQVAKGAGAVFTPTTGQTARVLGYAQRKGKIFNLVVENGSPRLATIETMVHELTHIWQYVNWDDKDIKKNYPKSEQRDIVYEGMAVWVSIQYLYLIGENSYAMQQEILQASREDVYGVGFRMYLSKYPLVKDASLVRYSPFTIFPPL